MGGRRRSEVPLNHRKYLLTVLVAILAWSYVERYVLGLVLQDIKTDLGLSDTQLGVLTGIAFALFYATLGIPIARLADGGNRVAIIGATTALQCGAVALCGSATNFVQLIFIRTGVAIGEAGCIPTAHSLIADYFSRAERARASSFYMAGVPLSMMCGYFLAGWINELYGWRMTFLLLALPGLVLSPLAWSTLKEPRREGMRGDVNADHLIERGDHEANHTRPSLRDVLVTLWANTTFRHLLICFTVTSFFAQGVAKWKPTFFIRSFGMETGELGTWFAVIYGVSGLLGLYWGGELASRFAANNERLQLKVMAIAYCGFGAISTCIYLSPSHYWAFVFLAIANLGAYMTIGPLFGTIQTLVPPGMRAMSIACIYLFSNLIGMGLGPLVAGVLSDAFQPWAGANSLRYALLALCPGYLWAGWHLWRGSLSVTRDLHAAQVNRHAVSHAENFDGKITVER